MCQSAQTDFHLLVQPLCIFEFQRTEHVLQADDAGEVVVKVDVIVGISKPQADQLQQAVVQLHAFIGRSTPFILTSMLHKHV